MNVDEQRRAAGEAAAALVRDGMALGYGTGRAAASALEALARRKLRVRGVPTSERTAELCRALKCLHGSRQLALLPPPNPTYLPQ